jgi:membrane carboxypeptidase/penicillin-binding protein
MAPYVAGKTGTTDGENDAWFVGFSNDVTIAVGGGYDNADGKRRTLGSGSTGGNVAVPIFEPIMQAVWAHVAPKTALAPPSAEARRLLSCKAIDVESGDNGGKFSECFRIDAKGKIVNTQYKLVSRDSSYAAREPRDTRARETRNPNAGYGYSYGWGWSNGGWYPYQEQRRYYGNDGYRGSWGGWGRW